MNLCFHLPVRLLKASWLPWYGAPILCEAWYPRPHDKWHHHVYYRKTRAIRLLENKTALEIRDVRKFVLFGIENEA